LIQKNKQKAAETILQRIRPKYYDVSNELSSLLQSSSKFPKTIDEEENLDTKINERKESEPNPWIELFKMKKIVIIGVGSMAIQQLCGINSVMYYSSTIFGFAGIQPDGQTYATIGVTGLNVIMTIISVWLIDRLGRRPLLLGGLTVVIASLLTASFSLLFISNTTGGYICTVMIMTYVAGFAIGLGAVLWPVLGEIFPSRVRSQGMSLCLFVNWTFNLIISLSTLSLVDLFGGKSHDGKSGVAYLFLCYAVFSALGFFFFYFLLPETKGKSLEKIQEELGQTRN